ncbi:MAG: hypothetical protein HRT35_04035 [Algicola sp.]|nr:hypothetical protein [Algicola sp.]
MNKRFLLLLLALGLTAAVEAKTSEILTGELALNHTLAADIPPDTIQTRIGKEGLDDLYNRFEQHYGEFVRKDNPRKVDFDFIFGAKNAQTTMDLHYQLGLAIEERLPMERFAKFGITSKDDGSFSYDLKHSPYLATPNNLFAALTTASSIRILSYSLLKKGFRQNDIPTLKSYLTLATNERGKPNLAYITYLNEKLSFFETTFESKQVLKPEHYQQVIGQPSYIRHYLNFNHHRNLALTLLSQFKAHPQRILISYLVASLSTQVSLAPSSPPKNGAPSRFERELKSGQLRQKIKSHLNTHQNGENI